MCLKNPFHGHRYTKANAAVILIYFARKSQTKTAVLILSETAEPDLKGTSSNLEMLSDADKPSRTVIKSQEARTQQWLEQLTKTV